MTGVLFFWFPNSDLGIQVGEKLCFVVVGRVKNQNPYFWD